MNTGVAPLVTVSNRYVIPAGTKNEIGTSVSDCGPADGSTCLFRMTSIRFPPTPPAPPILSFISPSSPEWSQSIRKVAKTNVMAVALGV